MKKIIRSCHNCEYRHACYDEDCKESNNYPNWKISKCYNCKYYIELKLADDKSIDKLTDEWFARGCEIWFPSSICCEKYIRINERKK